MKANPTKKPTDCIDAVKTTYVGKIDNALCPGKDAWEEILKGKEMRRLFAAIEKLENPGQSLDAKAEAGNRQGPAERPTI